MIDLTFDLRTALTYTFLLSLPEKKTFCARPWGVGCAELAIDLDGRALVPLA